MSTTSSDSLAGLGAGWRKFWFTPTDPTPLGAARAAVGAVLFYWFVAFSTDLIAFFGPNGLAPLAFTAEHWGAGKISLLYLSDSPAWLWSVHAAALAASAAMVVGWGGRATVVVVWVIFLSYANRAPQLTCLFEPTAAFVLLYLWIGPSGGAFSLGRREAAPASFSAGIALRLLQVHLAAWFGLSALAKYSDASWWNGTAMWRLAIREAGPLVDLTSLHAYPFFWNAWTHLIPTFELAFALLIWYRLWRPWLLLAMPLVLAGPALLTGEFAYYLLLCGAALSFAEPRQLRAFTRRFTKSPSGEAS